MSNGSFLKTERGKVNVLGLVVMGMLTAIGMLLVAFIEFPLIPAADFLKYDPADIPILIGTLLYGPIAGVILTVLVSFAQSFFIHGSGGPIGFVMHVAATGAMVIAAGMIYRQGKGAVTALKKDIRAVFALVAGVLTMTAVMVGMNLWLTPIYMGAPIDAVIRLLLPAIIPFNLLKAGMNSAAAFLVYRIVGSVAPNLT